jgi:hypothetical protein
VVFWKCYVWLAFLGGTELEVLCKRVQGVPA